jgi:hypothetical protein
MSEPVNRTDRPALEPARCPLCGRPNRCALAADPNATECWCDSKVFPRNLLERIPEDALNRVCICQKCLEEQKESANTYGNS